jgi:mRNA-degrading endonuclease HigB of HigAB toxin-antitoxin module
MEISKETLDAVIIGILTDSQLQEALQHYTQLERGLRVHGEQYHLVWADVFRKLEDLKHFWQRRSQSRNLIFDIEGNFYQK